MWTLVWVEQLYGLLRSLWPDDIQSRASAGWRSYVSVSQLSLWDQLIVILGSIATYHSEYGKVRD